MTRYNEAEYLDALVTLELAAQCARLDNRPISAAIRWCWNAIRPRVTNELNRNIFDNLARQPFPYGALSLLRRKLDEAVSE